MASDVTIFRGSPHTDLGNVLYNTITTKLISSNVATIGSLVDAAVGNLVFIAGVDSTIDGTHVIDTIPSQAPSGSPAGRSFTYSTSAGNVASANVSPEGIVAVNSSYVGGTVTNISAVNYLTTVTTSADHGLVLGDIVAVETKANLTLAASVISAPTSKTFTYISPTQTIANAATTGAWTKIPAVYTAPANISTRINNISISNRGAASATYSIYVKGDSIAENVTLAAATSTYITLEQIVSNGEKLVLAASSNNIMFNIAGENV